MNKFNEFEFFEIFLKKIVICNHNHELNLQIVIYDSF